MIQRTNLSLKLIISTILLTTATAVHSQDTLSLKVYFHVSKSQIDRDYCGNGQKLDNFISRVNNLQKDGRTGIKYIAIETSCSPEGGYEYNERLAMDRARSIRSYIINRLAINASQIRTYSTGINWEDFYNRIYDTDENECPWKDELTQVLAKYSLKTNLNKEDSDNCNRDIKNIDYGRAWRWIVRSGILEELRQASGQITCVMDETTLTSTRDTIVIIHEYEGSGNDRYDSLAVVSLVDNRIEKKMKKAHSYKKDSLFRIPVFAFRSNLLVPLTNIGIEIPLGNRWSIEADWYSPWVYRNWMNQLTSYYENCFQVQLAYLETRVWLGSNHSRKHGNPVYRLRGHSIGFGIGAFHYDLGRNKKGEQGDGAAFGMDYQYAAPLGKGGAHFEFTIGVCGYYRTYQRYIIEDDRWDGDIKIQSNKLLANDNRKEEIFVAPFRAAVSLVIPIFKKKEVSK